MVAASGLSGATATARREVSRRPPLCSLVGRSILRTASRWSRGVNSPVPESVSLIGSGAFLFAVRPTDHMIIFGGHFFLAYDFTVDITDNPINRPRVTLGHQQCSAFMAKGASAKFGHRAASGRKSSARLGGPYLASVSHV